MKIIQPTKEWYESISRQNGVPLRCPFANVHRCPRHYYSISILGKAGIMTEIEKDLDDTLSEKWKKSDLRPVVAEQDTGFLRLKEEIRTFDNLCPEVSFDVFRLFVSYLHGYSDEIDTGIAHKHLGDLGASSKDFRWAWENVTPLHYLSCTYYSLLQTDAISAKEVDKDEKFIDLKPNFHGISLNLNLLLNKIKNWIQKGRKII